MSDRAQCDAIAGRLAGSEKSRFGNPSVRVKAKLLEQAKLGVVHHLSVAALASQSRNMSVLHTQASRTDGITVTDACPSLSR